MLVPGEGELRSLLLFRPVDPFGPLALLPPDVCSQGQRSPWLPHVGWSLSCLSPFRPLRLGSPDLWAGLIPPPGQSCGSGTAAWDQGPSEARSENKWPIATQLQEEKAIVFQPESKGFVPGNQPVWQNLSEISVQFLLSQQKTDKQVQSFHHHPGVSGVSLSVLDAP